MKTLKNFRPLALAFLLLIFSPQLQAQVIDSFALNRSVYPHQLFVRLHFPDSSYHIPRTLERVSLIYPPVNSISLYHRSCTYIKNNPVQDMVINIDMPEPYRIKLWLIKDSNTVNPDCEIVAAQEVSDSTSYDSRQTGIAAHTPWHPVSLFPNPATDQVHINQARGKTMRLYDISGKILLNREAASAEETIDLRHFAPGAYYMAVYEDGRRLQLLPFTKAN